MSQTPQFNFDSDQRFTIKNYDEARPFSSFLPGIAGPMGVPMWVFYVNRGQAITSFGIESKDAPIMEFQPANRAYQQTGTTGFRTFLTLTRSGNRTYYEPFSATLPTNSGMHDDEAAQPQRRMTIGMNELHLSEQNEALGLKMDVTYFTPPGEHFAGLVRRVTLTNTGDDELALEALDGAPAVIPYGVDNGGLKMISRTLEAWMEVANIENRLPFYRLKASAGDTAEVEAVVAGHFALAFVEDGELLSVIADPTVVFGQNTGLSAPDPFVEEGLTSVLSARQINTGKTPCAFFGTAATLVPGQSVTITSIFGHSASLDQILADHPRLLRADTMQQKYQEALSLAETVTYPMQTKTGSPTFDAYCRQTFLDNVLRGGWPLLFKREGEREGAHEGKPHVYHVYSRKHGDPERDYNAFFLAAEYYSQGNGNYRDVNQNRRMDTFFQPGVGDFNVRVFLSLIQADGNNPLVVKGTTFTVTREERAVLSAMAQEPERLEPLLAGYFTPGKLLKQLDLLGIELNVPKDEFLSRVMATANQHIEADFGEGYWVDHWTYNLDLIESYLAIFPEGEENLLFGGPGLPFFDSPATVRPRAQKYVLAGGEPRQFNAINEDEEKEVLLHARTHRWNWMRSGNGYEKMYTTTVAVKLILLAGLKYSALDPSGMGVEMESGKPGWYDALNGLPGLFGSSMPETYELDRLLTYLRESLGRYPHQAITLPVELAEMLENLSNIVGGSLFERWDARTHTREVYRARVRFGIRGEEVDVLASQIVDWVTIFQEQVQAGIKKAESVTDGVPPTYFVHTVTSYDVVLNEVDDPLKDERGRPLIRVNGFEPQVLPLFLEGPVRALKIADAGRAGEIYAKVKQSPLYDAPLGMYKVNTSLAEQPHDIGRARAFTPGWLENESIWLHMEYKYLLATLKAGLYEEFFADFKTALIPFQDPAVYGRSPLENSSFIVSSAHPDESIHGAGFVARLSGSTAEFLEIWMLMMVGKQPFRFEDGELSLRFHPALPGWLFDEEGCLTFTFLGQTPVTYHNPSRQDTYAADAEIERIMLHSQNGEHVQLDGATIPDTWARAVRAGQIQSVEVFWA